MGQCWYGVLLENVCRPRNQLRLGHRRVCLLVDPVCFDLRLDSSILCGGTIEDASYGAGAKTRPEIQSDQTAPRARARRRLAQERLAE
jgi:hypothetical protein